MIVNIVVTANLHLSPLRMIELSLIRGAQYNPTKFHGVIIPLERKVRCLCFESGKIVCVGGKSIEEVRKAFQQLEEILTEEGHFGLIGDFKIQNIVASFNYGQPIDLGKLKRSYSNKAKYEPEFFPGLRYKLATPSCSVVAFTSGKYYITGLKSVGDADLASLTFEEVLDNLI